MIRIFFIWICFFGFFAQAEAQLLPSPVKKKVSQEQQNPSKPAEEKPIPEAPQDEFNRGQPRSSVKGYLKATNQGDYELAVEYLDLRNLPDELDKEDGPELAKQLNIILDRALWLDMDLISQDPKGRLDDNLPSYRDSLGQIKAGEKSIPVMMQRVPRGDGVYIWKFSNRTVGQIPLLYQHHGYTPLEEFLEGVFPDFTILGWQSWQWATYLVLHLIALLIAWGVSRGLSAFVRRKETPLRKAVGDYFKGPLFIVLWLLIVRPGVEWMGPSDSIRVMHETATLLYCILTWAIVRLVDLAGFGFTLQLEKKGRNAATILMKPVKSVLKTIVILAGLLLWLENLGVHVGTLMASLGIGGFAVALAAQDMLKNLLGSIMILIDRPYEIGQRIVAKGYDGVVEEIGLRSTKLRLLNGHQVTIPNEEMAKIEIENIGRRPHIRRSSNLTIPLDTPVEKIEKAVEIVKQSLENHECMDQNYPPRVYFNEFNRDSVNIQMIIWYCSTDYWAFQKFNQKLNMNIIQRFEQEDIPFALPSFTAYSEQPFETHHQLASQLITDSAQSK